MAVTVSVITLANTVKKQLRSETRQWTQFNSQFTLACVAGKFHFCYNKLNH